MAKIKQTSQPDSDITIIMPHGMMGAEDARMDLLEAGLRLIAEAASEDSKEWPGKYGTKFENDVFTMHNYCWCEQDGCDYCFGSKPNFYFKLLDFDLRWYKFIGRDMEFNRELSPAEIAKMIFDCLESLESA